MAYNDERRQLDAGLGIGKMIDETGLSVCIDQDSMGLLTAAGNRTTVHEEDRVYGIMQVFGLQLGSSSPNMDSSRTFSLEELNDQLGAALLEQDPIMSQLFLHQSSYLPGKGWRISRHSIVPSAAKKFHSHKHTRPTIEHRAVLSTHSWNKTLWGRFSGPMIPFSVFAKQLLRDWPNAWHWGGARVLLDQIILDNLPETHRSSDLSRAAFLVGQHKPEVSILLLGSQSQPQPKVDKGPRSAVGLLLHHLPKDVSAIANDLKIWNRLGLFIWSIESTRSEEEAVRSEKPFRLLAASLDNLNVLSKDLPYLNGHGPDWRHISGLYG